MEGPKTGRDIIVERVLHMISLREKSGPPDAASAVPSTDKVFSCLVMMLPFLYQYRGVGSYISLGELLLIPFLFVYTIRSISDAKIDFPLMLFYATCILCTFAACVQSRYFDISSAGSLFMRMFFYGTLLLSGREHFSYRHVKKMYIAIALLFMLYLYIQFAAFSIRKIYLPIYFKYEWLFPSEQRAQVLQQYYQYAFRPSAFFMEPSYYALFMTPALVHTLISERRPILSLWITGSFFISGAVSGIILAAFIWMAFARALLKEHVIKVSDIAILVGVLMVTIYLLIAGAEYEGLRRLQTGGSFNYRITRGILIYGQMDVFHKLIGTGLNNLEAYVKSYGIITPYDAYSSSGYCATFIQTLCTMGVPGLVMLCYYLAGLRRRQSTQAQRVLFWAFVLLMGYEAILFTYRFAFYLFLLYSPDFGESIDLLRGKAKASDERNLGMNQETAAYPMDLAAERPG